MKSKIRKILIAAVLQILFAATLFAQKYENGTKLLKGAEVLSATPLQLDYVLENLSDTAKITVNLHEGKTHLVLNDGSGQWREWWYHVGRWKWKIPDNPLPVATTTEPGGIKVGSGLTVTGDGILSTTANTVTCGTFTPTVTGGTSVSYTTDGGSYGKYCINNRVVYIEIYLIISDLSGFTSSSDVKIGIPDELKPNSVGGAALTPSISIMRHRWIVSKSGKQLGGYLDGSLGVVKLTEYDDEEYRNIWGFRVGSCVQFSVTYIL